MEGNGKAGSLQAGEDFLAFSEGISQQHRRFALFQRLAAELTDIPENGVDVREDVVGTTERRLHDEEVCGSRFAGFGGGAWAEFEISGVEEGLAGCLDQCHGASENVAGGQERNGPGLGAVVECSGLAPIQVMLQAFPGQPASHQTGGGGAQKDFTMPGNVI